MTTTVDLSQLARPRPERMPAAAPHASRSFLARYVASAAIAAGFVALLVWAARDQLLPRTKVSAVPVITTRGQVRQEGTELFQAAGWIEPRPTPILVTALTEGVIEKLFVVEGKSVAAGEQIAKLIDTDARLALREAEAELALRRAEVASMDAELVAAELRLANPVHLDAALAEADSALARTETELGKIPFLIASEEAQASFAKQNLAGKRSVSESIAGRVIQQAESDLATAEAELAELRERKPRLEREAESLRRKRTAIAEQRRLLIEESRGVADIRAKRDAAIARQEQAMLAVERAKLMLDRTVIRAPSAGKILQLVARPGTRVTSMDGASALGAATIVTLYDPAMLQVRADVRLEDVGRVEPNQPVRIVTASLPAPIEGFVLQTTSIANIQKNTLEVKVAIKNPPPTIRPEMLVTATFMATPNPGTDTATETARERILIRKDLVTSVDDAPAVWVAAFDRTARLQPIRLGRDAEDGLVEVLEGLSPTDKLIVEGRGDLTPGERITVTTAVGE